MAVETRTRTVYYSPRRRRHFMTAKAAAGGEASARMRKWFPRESAEYEGHLMTYEGWDWRDVPRLVAIRDRLAERYLRQLLKEPTK